MASSQNMKKSGSFTGKGADKKVVLGFKPRKVEVYQVTDHLSSTKLDSMPAAKAQHRNAAGAGSYADHIVIEADGFTVKAALAASGKECHYMAYEGKNE